MRPIVGITSWFVLLAPLVLLSVDVITAADSSETQQALNIIADFANRICVTVPQTGKSGNVELSGKAKAELNELLKKIANLGIEGAAQYQASQYEGVLQRELAEQLDKSRDCQREVSQDLINRLLPPLSKVPPPEEPKSEQRLREEQREALERKQKEEEAARRRAIAAKDSPLIINGTAYQMPTSSSPYCVAQEIYTGNNNIVRYDIVVPDGWVMMWDSWKAKWDGGGYNNNGLLIIRGPYSGKIEINTGGSCSGPIEWYDYILKNRREAHRGPSRPEYHP
jgi:hypothetical protein